MTKNDKKKEQSMSKKLRQAVQHANEENPSARTTVDKFKG